MKRALFAFLLLTQTAFAQDVLQRVADDAVVFDRVAQASKRDLPVDLLKRIVEEDIDLLRGKRSDGTYQYATFERFDSGRVSEDFSIQDRGDEKFTTVEVKGAWVYRVILEVPGRKLLVRRNRPVWVERVELDYVGDRGQTERQSIEIKQTLQPGELRPVDIPAVARQATARVVATAEKGGGYANIVVALVKAKIVDNADSPYADAVGSVKAIQRALENRDVPSIRSMAQRLRGAVGGAPSVPVRRAEPVAVATTVSQRSDTAERLEMQAELQVIEDLLTGTEQERRDGMDRLHQLIRRIR